jgi:hypothetical protein
MGNDHNRILFVQLVDQIFDNSGSDWIQCRAGFIHQNHFRIYRNRARDAKALLLSAGQARAGLIEPILDLLPQTRFNQRRFNDLIQCGFMGCQPMNSRPISNIFIKGSGAASANGH